MSDDRGDQQSREGRQLGFRYQLATSEGEVFDQAEYAFEPLVGDVVRVGGNRRMLVTGYVRSERIAEFIDDAIYGLLEVEPA